MNAALREAEFGNAARAHQQAASALAATRDLEALAALAFARAGDPERARKLADEAQQQAPLDTVVVKYWFPTVRAAIEIDRHNPAKAIAFLESASYESGQGSDVEFGVMYYPAYVRGKAFLLLHHGAEAAVEFHKLVDHPACSRTIRSSYSPISASEAANEFLREHYIAEFNRRFQRAAEQRGNAFLPPPRRQLERIFTLQFERTVNRDNTVSFQNLRLQIERVSWRGTLAGSSITVHQQLNGELSLSYGPHTLGRYTAQGEVITAPARRTVEKTAAAPPWKTLRVSHFHEKALCSQQHFSLLSAPGLWIGGAEGASAGSVKADRSEPQGSLDGFRARPAQSLRKRGRSKKREKCETYRELGVAVASACPLLIARFHPHLLQPL